MTTTWIGKHNFASPLKDTVNGRHFSEVINQEQGLISEVVQALVFKPPPFMPKMWFYQWVSVMPYQPYNIEEIKQQRTQVRQSFLFGKVFRPAEDPNKVHWPTSMKDLLCDDLEVKPPNYSFNPLQNNDENGRDLLNVNLFRYGEIPAKDEIPNWFLDQVYWSFLDLHFRCYEYRLNFFNFLVSEESQDRIKIFSDSRVDLVPAIALAWKLFCRRTIYHTFDPETPYSYLQRRHLLKFHSIAKFNLLCAVQLARTGHLPSEKELQGKEGIIAIADIIAAGFRAKNIRPTKMMIIKDELLVEHLIAKTNKRRAGWRDSKLLPRRYSIAYLKKILAGQDLVDPEAGKRPPSSRLKNEPIEFSFTLF
jgi:hypothetical protein